MARLPRFVLPGYPQHVIQRGNNRQRILFDEEDYWFLWDKLKAAAEKFSCDLHAYVLMPNHFHLLVTPGVDNGIGKLMQYVGRYYVQYFNRRYDRTGTLWEGRYRATLLDPAEFLLPCSRYIEENPVWMGFVDSPAEYAWSSYACNATGEVDELITHPGQYLRLGRSRAARQSAYAGIFTQPLDETVLKRIRDATNKAWVLGDDGFCRTIEGMLNRRPEPRPRGGDRRSEAYRRAIAAQAQ
jgi:putative transposase